MSFARDVYTATGGQTDFTISFGYLDDAHITVTQEGTALTETTHYTFPNATTVRLVTGATVGDTVVISRSTSQNTRLVDYTAGVLVESDLDNDSLQAFYMAQEAIDRVALSLGKDASELWDAESTRIINVATPSASTDAVTKAYADAISAAAGNVPTPGNPGEDNYLLSAGGGTWAWESPATIKSDLSLGALADLSTVDTAQIDASAVETAKINDNAVTLAKMEHGTSGDVLYYGASGVPTRLAKGSDDQVLTLASGLPSWAAAAGGMWEYVSKTAGSAVSEIDFTVASGYDYKFILRHIQPADDTNELQMRFSTDGGSTFAATNYVYHVSYRTPTASETYSGSSSGTFIKFWENTGNATGEDICGEVTVYEPSAAFYTKYDMKWVGADTTTALRGGTSHGMWKDATAVDAIRFFWQTTGNFAAQGAIEVYRRAAQ